jgi:hypothetical protein
MEQKGGCFQQIITGHESWFFFGYPRGSFWTASGNELPQCIKHEIDTEKCLVSAFWSVNGIHSLFDARKATSYSRAFFTYPQFDGEYSVTDS